MWSRTTSGAVLDEPEAHPMDTRASGAGNNRFEGRHITACEVAGSGGLGARPVMIHSEGLQVAEVDDANAIRLQKVQVGRDLGKAVEIVSGLSEGARIVTNPTDTLVDGMPVRIAGTETASAKPKQLAKR